MSKLTAPPRPEVLPLAPAQQRIWFIHRLSGALDGDNIPLELDLRGDLGAGVLGAALGDVVARHEVLRTVFPEGEGGEPCQRILEDPLEWPRLTVLSLPLGELPGALAQEVGRAFDLADEPPLRAVLYRHGARHHTLLLLLHHIAVDGWSTDPLLRDLASAYRARSAGAAPGWAELPLQYADYTLWQQRLLGDPRDPGSVHARQTHYWAGALAALPAQLPLRTDRPRPARPSYRSTTYRSVLPAGLYQAVHALARAERVSPFMVLQAALAAVLTRHGAGTDIPLGTPTAGRTHQDLENLVGFFVNTLVLRTDTSGDPTFRTLLRRVRSTDLDAYTHQDLPFDHLVTHLNPPRHPARHPLYQVAFTLQNHRRPPLDVPGLQVKVAEQRSVTTSAFDLAFAVAAGVGPDGEATGWQLHLTYATDLFDPETAEALATDLGRILTGAAADPNLPISRL